MINEETYVSSSTHPHYRQGSDTSEVESYAQYNQQILKDDLNI